MTDDTYQEPTNEQLAKFLMVYSKQIPGMENLALDEGIIRELMDLNPRFRAGALRHHKAFQKNINEYSEAMLAGKLQCEHIRENGKQCPNMNQPGTSRCGLHQF